MRLTMFALLFAIAAFQGAKAQQVPSSSNPGGTWYGSLEKYTYSEPRRILVITTGASKPTCTWDEEGTSINAPALCSVNGERVKLTTRAGSDVTLTLSGEMLKGSFTLKNGQSFNISMGRVPVAAQGTSPAESANWSETLGDAGGTVVATFHGIVSSTGSTWATLHVGSMRAVVASLHSVRVKQGDVVQNGTVIGTAQSGQRATISVCLDMSACNGAPWEWPQAARGRYAQLEQASLRLRTLKECEQTVEYDLESPTANVPEGIRAFSGVWLGKWDFGLCSALVVESVKPDGNVNVLYIVGSFSQYGIKAGSTRFAAKIIGNKLSAIGRTITVEYVMSSPTKLSGTYTSSIGQFSGSFTRQ